MVDARNYSTATRAALFQWGQGTCYHPDCSEPVIKVVDGDPYIVVFIAHIEAAEENGPRYNPLMSDDERRHINNLMLLCKPHHDIIDGPKKDDYPVALLQEWKRNHEQGKDLSPIGSMSADELPDLIQSAVAVALGENQGRLLEVELAAAVWAPGDQLLSVPIAGIPSLRSANLWMLDAELGLVIHIRNTGITDMDISDVRLMYDIEIAGKAVMPLTFAGRNDFPYHNPQLPHRLLNGSKIDWLTKGKSVGLIAEPIQNLGHRVSQVYAVVVVATNETFESPVVPWSQVESILK